ncbi:MAG: NnrS family protein [Bdellovibrionota bacterium]
MSFVQINKTQTKEAHRTALFELGFRPFFIGAGVFAVVSILAWLLVYGFQYPIQTTPYSLFEWHAHEMIYGFSLAVISGFLLTAIMNWTGVQTLNGTKLQLLFIAWLVPRIALLFGTTFISIAAIFDLLFVFGLLYAVTSPILKAKQLKQFAIVTIIGLLALGNLIFYLDAFNIYQNGAFVGIYGGLFLVISLILTIGGRVMPAFIKNGVDQEVDIKNPLWVALLSLGLFIVFSINYIFLGNSTLTGSLSLLLFIFTSYRLFCWHTPGIWSKPLLWGLFCAYLFINLGFLLFAAHAFMSSSVFFAIHAFAYGGIGLATLAMMPRVSLGHTARSVRSPPRGTSLILIVLTLGALMRVVLPIFDAVNYISL